VIYVQHFLILTRSFTRTLKMNNLIENEELIDELATQLNDTEEANHKAFVAIEGEEP
jgi:hypothetical protein